MILRFFPWKVGYVMLVPWNVVVESIPMTKIFWNHSSIETSICKWMCSGSWFEYMHMIMIGLVWRKSGWCWLVFVWTDTTIAEARQNSIRSVRVNPIEMTLADLRHMSTCYVKALRIADAKKSCIWIADSFWYPETWKANSRARRTFVLGYSNRFGMFLWCFLRKRCLQLVGVTHHRSHRGSPKKNNNWSEHNFTYYFSGTKNKNHWFPPKKAFFGEPYFGGGGEFWGWHWEGWPRDSHDKLQSCKSQQILQKQKVAQRPRRLWWKKLRSKFCLSGAQQGFREHVCPFKGPLEIKNDS